MTRAQKKQYVIQLYEEDKNYKEIAKLTHKSIRDISAIIKEHTDKIERENGQVEEKDGDYNNIKSKSKTTQAIKMFSEGQEPTQVVIELDLPPEEVRMIYRQYLETKNMYDFLQVYDQIRHSSYSISSFLRLHRIVNDLRMGEQQIINVLNLAKYSQLELLQSKVEYLASEVNMLEEERTKCTDHIAILNNRRDEYMKAEYMHESHLQQLREEIDHMENQFRLPRLENKISGLPYNAEMYSTSGVYNSRTSSIEHYVHPVPEDRSIEPVPSNMGLATSDSSSSLIEDIAWKIFDSSADEARIS